MAPVQPRGAVRRHANPGAYVHWRVLPPGACAASCLSVQGRLATQPTQPLRGDAAEKMGFILLYTTCASELLQQVVIELERFRWFAL
jgi:hypothetical protein